MTDLPAIQRLRAIAARLVEREDADAAWFAAALQEYTTGAPLGVTMEHAFRLGCGQGARPWWIAEAQEHRDELIRAIVALRFSGSTGRAAARGLWHQLSRYQACGWLRDRAYLSPPAGPQADYFRLLRLGAPLSEATIRRVLSGSRIPPVGEPVVARR